MPDHAEFVRAIHDTLMSGDVSNPGPDLVYADWLDERGDPLGRLIRAHHEQAIPLNYSGGLFLARERNLLLSDRPDPLLRLEAYSLHGNDGGVRPDRVRLSADVYHPDNNRYAKTYTADFSPHEALDIVRGMNLVDGYEHLRGDPPSRLEANMKHAGLNLEPRREARRRYALQQATSYPLAARIARSRNSRSLAMIASKVLSRLDLHPHATNHALHDDGRAVTPDVISVVGGRQQDPARVRYAAAWYGLVADRPGVLAFTPRPGGPHALYRLDLKGKASDLRAAMDQAGLKQRVLVPRQHGFSVYVFDQDGSYRDRVADLATRAGVQVAAAEGDGEVMGHPDDPGKARESYRAVTRAAEQPQRMARVGDRAEVVTDTGHNLGAGKVTYTAERTEVMFDRGGGGMFPNRFIRKLSRSGPTRRYAASDDTWQWHATTLQDMMRRAAASTQDLPGDLSDYIDRIGQLPAAGERINRILAAQIVRHTPAGDGRLFDLLDEPGRRAVETAERHAHGLATDEELAEAHASLGGEAARTPEGAARSAARAASGPVAAEAANLAARHASLAADWSGGGGSAEGVHKRLAKALYYAPKPAGLKRVAFARRGQRRYSRVDHEAFWKAIEENPGDNRPWQVYADHLEESGDPAGPVIREAVERGWWKNFRPRRFADPGASPFGNKHWRAGRPFSWVQAADAHHYTSPHVLSRELYRHLKGGLPVETTDVHARHYGSEAEAYLDLARAFASHRRDRETI